MKKLLLILLCVPLIGLGQSWEKTLGTGWYGEGESVQQTDPIDVVINFVDTK